MWGQSSWLWSETSPWRSCSSCGVEKAQDRGFLEPLGPARLWQQGCDREGTGRVWHPLWSKQRPTRSVRSCGDFTGSGTGPVPPAQLLTSSPLAELDVCPDGSLWMCWGTPSLSLHLNIPAGSTFWGYSFIPGAALFFLGLLLYSWSCLWTARPAVLAGPVPCCVSPIPSPLAGAAETPQEFTPHSTPALFALSQVEQLYLRQVVDEAGKSCSSSPMLPMAEEPQHEQGYRIFQDICTPRPLFRESQQIAV